MRRIPIFAWVIVGTVATAFLFSYVWSQQYPPVEAERDAIASQIQRISTVSTSCITFSGVLVGALAAAGYLRRRKSVKAEEARRLRTLFVQALVLNFLSIGWGILLLVNLSVQRSLEYRLPMSLFSIRTDLFLQVAFLVVGFIYAVRVLIGREK